VKQEGGDDSPALGRKGPSPPTADAALSSAKLREVRRLIRHVDGSLGRVRTPTLIIYAREDDSMLANVRYVQLQSSSQFLEFFLVPGKLSATHDDVFDRKVFKVVEFFNDVARRRVLAAMSRA
jgi:hypothetical protein